VALLPRPPLEQPLPKLTDLLLLVQQRLLLALVGALRNAAAAHGLGPSLRPGHWPSLLSAQGLLRYLRYFDLLILHLGLKDPLGVCIVSRREAACVELVP